VVKKTDLKKFDFAGVGSRFSQVKTCFQFAVPPLTCSERLPMSGFIAGAQNSYPN